VRVLVVEDEVALAEAIGRVLRRLGMAVDVAADGPAALRLAAAERYDVVILDRGLPGLHGDEVCRRLAARDPAVKLLMLSARDQLRDRVEGLELGADDYLVKPASMRELVARVQALGRRRGEARPPVLAWGDLRLDPARRELTRADRPVMLTAKELAVLEELMAAGGAAVPAERLLHSVWDDSHGEPFLNTVRVTVARLRSKLGEPNVIETVVGSGYRLR
jgi:DNA-binding response OmpR family regulator